MKQILIDWYNAHIVAAWYRSWAIWVAVLSALSPYLLDGLQYALDNWPTVGQYFHIGDGAKEALRLVLLLVVLPVARAWQQRTMQAAAAKQQAEKQT